MAPLLIRAARAALIWGGSQAGELWPRETSQQACLQPESWRTGSSIESQPLPCDADDNLKPSCCFGGIIPLFTLTQLGAECCSLTVKIVCGWLLFHTQWSICSELSKPWKKIQELPSLLLEWARLERGGSHSLKYCWEINWLREH